MTKIHLNKALRGIDIDPESKGDKLYHLACSIASLMMLLDGQINDTVIDNRNYLWSKVRWEIIWESVYLLL